MATEARTPSADGLHQHQPRLVSPQGRRPRIKEGGGGKDPCRLPPAEVKIVTDGSAKEGAENGGAGVVIYDEDQEIGRIVEPAGRYTSSYRAELDVVVNAF